MIDTTRIRERYDCMRYRLKPGQEYRSPYAAILALCDEVDRLRAELAAEWEKNRWIPCSERLPDSLDVVMVNITEVDGSPVMDMAYYNSNDSAAPYNGWQTNYFMVFGKVTHWRPLPEPPEEQQP